MQQCSSIAWQKALRGTAQDRMRQDSAAQHHGLRATVAKRLQTPGSGFECPLSDSRNLPLLRPGKSPHAFKHAVQTQHYSRRQYIDPSQSGSKNTGPLVMAALAVVLIHNCMIMIVTQSDVSLPKIRQQRVFQICSVQGAEQLQKLLSVGP